MLNSMQQSSLDYKPQIDRRRHVNSQLAISPDSPTDFHIKHTKVDKILFTHVHDPHLREQMEIKRIRSQGKSINMEQYKQTRRPNLSLVEDRRVNETVAESEARLIRKPLHQSRIYDTISCRTKEYSNEGRVVSQRNAFQETYSSYSKDTFKRTSGALEQYCNFQVGMRNVVGFETHLQKLSRQIQRTRYRIPNKSQTAKPDKSVDGELIYKNPNMYSNQLNHTIAKNNILNIVRGRQYKFKLQTLNITMD